MYSMDLRANGGWDDDNGMARILIELGGTRLESLYQGMLWLMFAGTETD